MRNTILTAVAMLALTLTIACAYSQKKPSPVKQSGPPAPVCNPDTEPCPKALPIHKPGK